MRDLTERYKFFSDWAAKNAPHVFWIGAFTYPTGFTTSLLQRYSRRGGAPSIDKLEFDFIPI
jgi:dynein heavy chain